MLLSFGEQDKIAVLFYLLMPKLKSMKAIEMKAQVMPKITMERVTSVIVTNRLPIAIAGVIICYFGMLIGSDLMTYTGAFAGIFGVKPVGKKVNDGDNSQVKETL